ncbi:2-phosphosulfolactate phosphatase [Pseudofrankia inefficax]|uniref:Probable 2-phosphosulfolactate phosphatase n=1 Tax=Pseudofrankia inefficax (strain DSM 45817 / CECT 9037 / DDB 130130 / EuI1c) TaxID=298654 RepID=E3J1N6_PSEI1|nr:2-phosphosulfolactate phosphatase [Pseudofrankia inefficax]ADP81704.1 putative lipoprotein [Pseudofrankia inefficax]
MGAFTDQAPFAVRFGWGPDDLAALAPGGDVVVIVDVLRFTTAVSVAVSRGAHVLPHRWRDQAAARFAAERGALLGGRREDPDAPWSLSPTDLAAIPPGTRLVLPSPNGATLSAAALELGVSRLLAGCLRNAAAVGRAAAAALAGGGHLVVIASGERWPDVYGDPHRGPLRPAVEDLLGAGAVIARTVRAAGLARDRLSAEARAAMAAFLAAEPDLHADLRASASGRELLALGWDDDIAAAAALDVDQAVPVLTDGAFTASD